MRGTSSTKLNPLTVTCYTWTENEYKKGSNEIASCIFNTLNTSDFTGAHTIRLMCDGYGGHNKNTTLISMCCNWFSKQRQINQMEIVFPVRGHSFIPPTESGARRSNKKLEGRDCQIHKTTRSVAFCLFKNEKNDYYKECQRDSTCQGWKRL